MWVSQPLTSSIQWDIFPTAWLLCIFCSWQMRAITFHCLPPVEMNCYSVSLPVPPSAVLGAEPPAARPSAYWLLSAAPSLLELG